MDVVKRTLVFESKMLSKFGDPWKDVCQLLSIGCCDRDYNLPPDEQSRRDAWLKRHGASENCCEKCAFCCIIRPIACGLG